MEPWNRPLRVPQTGHPAVKALFRACNQQQLHLADLARRSGVAMGTIKAWRLGQTPSVSNLEACLNVVGLRLTAVPYQRKDSEHGVASPDGGAGPAARSAPGGTKQTR